MIKGTKIITINVQGLCGSESRNLLVSMASLFRIRYPVCVQETHATSIQEFSSWVEDYNARARRTRNCAAKAHRVARVPVALPFFIARFPGFKCKDG